MVGSAVPRPRANVLLVGNRGPWTSGSAAAIRTGATRRWFRGPRLLDPRTDQSFVLNAGVQPPLSRIRAVPDAAASWYDSDRPLFDPVFSSGITGSYYRSLMFERLQFHAALGIFYTDTGPIDSTVASALVGLRYTF